jgi:predicted regulator of Ras-like GTPase activity (Roadblock/LC7/MglB family)
MKEVLKDILEIDGVNGVIILTDEGKTIFEEISPNSSMKLDDIEWKLLIDDIQSYREIELIYENGLIYIRKIEFGFMVVLVDVYVQVAMIRLNCDIILSSLQDLKSNKKYKHLFKK